VDLDEFPKAFDAVLGECHDTVIAQPVDQIKPSSGSISLAISQSQSSSTPSSIATRAIVVTLWTLLR
jgi:hypothetical protein